MSGMEALLMGGDSSDDSDNEQAKNKPKAQQPAAAPPSSLAAPVPAPAAAPVAPTGPPPPNASQSDVSQRLRSLYSPAANKGVSSKPAAVPQQPKPPQASPQQAPAPSPSHHHPPPQRHVAPPTQHHARQTSQPHPSSDTYQNRPQQTRHSISAPLASPPHGKSGSSGSSHHQAMPPQTQPLSRGQSLPPMSHASPGSSRGRDSREQVPYAPQQQQRSSSSHHRGTSSGHHHLQQQQQQQHSTNASAASHPSSSSSHRHQQPPHRVTTAGSSSSSTTPTHSNLSTAQQHAAQQHRIKKEKETFLVFTRVLMKYLEQKDPSVFARVKNIIKDCAERNKRNEPGYESVTISMRSQLKKVVSDAHWKRAEQYLKHFLQQKKQQAAGGGRSTSTASSTSQADRSQYSSSQQPSPGGMHSTASPSRSKAELEQEQRKKMLQMHKERQEAAAAARKLGPVQGNPRTISSLRKDIAAQRQALEQQAPSGAASTTAPTTAAMSKPTPQPPHQQHPPTQFPVPASHTSASAPTTATKPPQPIKKTSTAQSSKGKAAVPTKVKKQTSVSSRTTPSDAPHVPSMSSQIGKSSWTDPTPPAPAVVEEPIPPAIVKEYTEVLKFDKFETVTAMDDWTSTALLLGPKSRATWTEEQRQLLRGPFGDTGDLDGPPTTRDAAKCFPRPNWHDRNVLNARAAWVRVRLREQELAAKESAQMAFGVWQPHGEYPVVAGGLLALPAPTDENSSKASPTVAWEGEEAAQEDKTLSLLSEATQIYLRQVLEKAVHCARQRENVDGVRLWHEQVTEPQAKQENKSRPLSLRLGCNIDCQVAQAQGNAAMTVKHMEQALEQKNEDNDPETKSEALDSNVLSHLLSMEEASFRPKLAKAAEEAASNAKRAFQTYQEGDGVGPPLGRVEKKAKLHVVDFQMGMNMGRTQSFGKHRAHATGSFFSF